MTQLCIDFSPNYVTIEQLNRSYDQYVHMRVSVLDEIASQSLDDFKSVTYDNTFKALINLGNEVQKIIPILKLDTLYVSDNIRKKCTELNMRRNEFDINQVMRKDVYQVLHFYEVNVFPTDVKNNLLTSEEIRYVENNMRDLRVIGLQLPDDQFNRIKEIKTQLAQNSSDYNRNLAEFSYSECLTGDDLIGMPESWLNDRLIKNENENENENEKLYKVTLAYPDYIPLIKSCSNKRTRQHFYDKFYSKCADSNPQLLESTLSLRQEMAQILSYPSFADLQLLPRMAKTPDIVLSFLNKLIDQMSKIVRSEINTLSENVDETISVSDINYYSQLYIENKLKYSEQQLNDFFNVEVVTAGILRIYQQLFGYTFVDVTEENKNTLWHESVRMYQCYFYSKNNENVNKNENKNENENLTLKGTFYLDLFPRKGKFGHACMKEIIGKSATSLPVIFLITNFSSKGGMTHDDVKTMFHEFGHVIHAMSSTTMISDFTGTSCETDFLECPSQLFEEWCYVPETLRIMSPDITDEAIEYVQCKRKLLQGLQVTKQLSFALYDMNIHLNCSNNTDENEQMGVSCKDIYNSIHEQLFGLKVTAELDMSAVFGHIMSGYEVGYYSYLWSQAFAMDIYQSKFKGHELDQSVGVKFRDQVLSVGGQRNSLDMLTEYLGRAPDSTAFINYLGNNY